MEKSEVKIKPTAPQQEVINSNRSLIVAIAGPGAGKTRTVIERIKRLASLNEDAISRICSITFTRAGSKEITKRLKSSGFEGIGYNGTLHSLMLKLIREFHKDLGYSRRPSLFPESELKEYIKKIRDDLKYKSLSMDKVMKSMDSNNKTRSLRQIFNEFTIRLKNDNVITYDRMLDEGLRLLKNESIVDQIKDRWDHLIVDEAQDSSAKDFEIYKRLPIANMLMVGDPDQCQPAGTMVKMSDGKTEKPIEDLKIGDSVISYERHGKVLIKAGKVSDISKRNYSGCIYTVKAGGKISKSTGNHKWLIKWLSGNERNVNNYCTYLMRKGNRFRIGKILFFRSSGSKKKRDSEKVIGLTSRLSQEKADQIWVLKMHDTEQEAVIYEEVVSANYGISQVCFKESNTAINLTQPAIDEIFNSINFQTEKAERCLNAHGRDILYPMVDRNANRTRRTVQEIHACNLISGLMKIPVMSDDYDRNSRSPEWKTLEVSYELEMIEVWSLNIEKYHKYISNNMVTCNSIFGFRGSDPTQLQSKAEAYDAHVIKMEANFRSTPEICEAAQRLIEYNFNRIKKKTISQNANGNNIRVQRFTDGESEKQQICIQVKELIENGIEPSEIAILTRFNRDMAEYKEHLKNNLLPVDEDKGGYFPKRWNQSMMILDLMADPENNLIAELVLNVTHGLHAAKTAKIQSQVEGVSINDVMRLVKTSMPVTEAINSLQSDWNADHGFIEMVRESMKGLNDPSISEVVEAVRESQMESKVEGSGIFCGSIHSSKGREWKAVFLPVFESGSIPHKRSPIEEERNLAYVAMTRAKHFLSISFAENRMISFFQGSNPKLVTRYPSPFINEID